MEIFLSNGITMFLNQGDLIINHSIVVHNTKSSYYELLVIGIAQAFCKNSNRTHI